MVNHEHPPVLHMLDTCKCIVEMRRINAGEIIPPFAGTALSAIVVAELSVAAHKHAHARRRTDEIKAFLSRFEILPFDARAAEHYAEIRALLEKSGTLIGPMDLLIAAHARSLGATLITNNAREFKRVPGLKLLTP